MADPEQSSAQQLGPPEVMAANLRRSYKTFFMPSAVCGVASIGFAVGHDWLYSVVFLAAGLMYFPVSLSQYRRAKAICEKTVTRYRQWSQEQEAGGKG